MKKYTIILLCILLLSVLSGCGSTPAEETFSDLTHGYQELKSLSGYGISDVNRILGEELVFVEEKWGDTDTYRSSENHIYYFYKEIDALYMIDYMNLTVEEAYNLAKQSHDEISAEYGDENQDATPVAIHDLKSADYLNEHYKQHAAEQFNQYGESFFAAYNERMRDKAKDFLDLERPTIGLNIFTPEFMKGLGYEEAFAVRVAHSSMPKAPAE